MTAISEAKSAAESRDTQSVPDDHTEFQYVNRFDKDGIQYVTMGCLKCDEKYTMSKEEYMSWAWPKK